MLVDSGDVNKESSQMIGYTIQDFKLHFVTP